MLCNILFDVNGKFKENDPSDSVLGRQCWDCILIFNALPVSPTCYWMVFVWSLMRLFEVHDFYTVGRLRSATHVT